jgi:mono/diheme cytochrome c family protein
MNLWKLAILFLCVIALVAAGYGAVLIRHGFSAKDEPSALEKTVARAVRNLSIPSDAKQARNAIPATPENLAAGREHFADHCATCHANDGSGDTEMGRNLYPKPPDLRLPQTQNLTDGEIFYIIQNGIRLTGMPAWGDSHEVDDNWKLVLFIRHLPNQTAEEKKDMERFNPKGADENEHEHEGETPSGKPTEEHHHH